jgi:hypothetical protein
MALGRPLRRERSKLVVKLKDVDKWTFEQIAKEIGVKSKSTTHFIYYAEKERSSKGELSPA